MASPRRLCRSYISPLELYITTSLWWNFRPHLATAIWYLNFPLSVARYSALRFRSKDAYLSGAYVRISLRNTIALGNRTWAYDLPQSRQTAPYDAPCCQWAPSTFSGDAPAPSVFLTMSEVPKKLRTYGIFLAYRLPFVKGKVPPALAFDIEQLRYIPRYYL